MEECREWLASKNNRGYGRKWDKERKKEVLAHRWVVAQVDGWDALAGMEVMHLCDNPACYRYSHLSIGTHAENMADMAEKGRDGHSRKTHCPKGHEYTDDNTYLLPSGVPSRTCKTCKREKNRLRRQQSKTKQ